MGSAQSTYSSQWLVGDAASRWALTSGNRWLEIGRPADSAMAAARVQPREMMVAVQRVLPEALRSRAVERPEAICDEIARGLAGVASTPQHESPDAIFERLGG